MLRTLNPYLGALLYFFMGLYLYRRAGSLTRDGESPESHTLRQRWVRRSGIAMIALAAITVLIQLWPLEAS